MEVTTAPASEPVASDPAPSNPAMAESGDLSQCGNCGAIVPAAELKPMPHSPGLAGCASCHGKLRQTGHHQNPLPKRTGLGGR